ncbi:MAG: hypothetical protein PHV20_07600 [Bacteroidales bacterium]|nr:hypothetical protein [Bacteroidales bacterium]
MIVKKQDFSGYEMALLYRAFATKLFTKPKIGDIWYITHKQDSGSTFYFNLECYMQLKNDMQFAYSQGKFSQSNANIAWINLINRFFDAESETCELESNLDNSKIALTELEHVQVLQKIMTAQQSTEKRIGSTKQKIINLKDEQNRSLEENEFNKDGELCKIVNYKFLDQINIVEKRTIDISDYINYSYIHRYKNDKILEEWIFMGMTLSSIDEWIYDDGGRIEKKITYPSYG